MLTGSAHATAAPVARAVSIGSVRAGLLPADKREAVRALGGVAANGGGRGASQLTAMVGDGINDATALAEATVGVAMGASGTALASESADVVMLTDNLERIPQAIELCRRARLVIYANIALSAAIKGGAIASASCRFGPLVDLGSLVLVIAIGSTLLQARMWDRAS